MTAPDQREFERRMRRIDALVAAVEAGTDATAREGARELVRALLDLHAAGLERMLRLAAPADALLDRWARDDLVGSLLLLHGLHPVPAAERVARALERACAELRISPEDVEVLAATAEEVRLRLRGDPSAGPTLRHALETALTEAVPDVAVVAFEEAWDRPPSGRIALPLLGTEPR